MAQGTRDTGDNDDVWRPSDGPGPAAPDHPVLKPGAVLGDYRLVRFLAKGGMGQVWEAERLSFGKRVALKLLLTGQALSAKQLDYFRREAMAGGRACHDAIVEVYDYGEVDGFPFMAQRLVPGGLTLHHVIERCRERGAVPDSWYLDVARYFAEAAEALHSVHQRGVIHRDLKPRNLLVSPDGRALVADFGLAKLQDGESLSRPGDVEGSLGYMSPEQLLAKKIGIDHQSDVFSLGATLYEALTLQHAFPGDSAPQVTERVIYHDPPEPRALRSKVPHELSIICMKALEKRRGDRYADMAAFAGDLRRWLAHEPIIARPPGPVARAGKWVRRHPVVSAAAGVAVLALAVMGWMQWRLERVNDQLVQTNDQLMQTNDKLERETRRADREAAAASERADELDRQKTELEASNEALRIARDEARRLTYSALLQGAQAEEFRGRIASARRLHRQAPLAHRGWEWDHIGLRLGLSLPTLTGHEGEVWHVAWSPDGARLASASDDNTVRLWDGTTGDELATLTGHKQWVNHVAWSPDGARLASASGDNTVRLWDGTTGDELATLTGHEAGVTHVAWSPDGARLASASYDNTVRLWNGTTGAELATLTGHENRVHHVAWSPDGVRLASASLDNTLRLWDGTTGDELATLTGHEAGVTHVAWSPDGARLASASGDNDNTVRLWDGTTGAELATLTGHEGGVLHVAWRPDGARLASASGDNDNTVRLWDGTTGDELATLTGHEVFVAHVAWSPDGARLASASYDNTVGLWDGTTGDELATLTGHEAGVRHVAWSPDGARLASASWDRTLRLWDGTTGQELVTLTGHKGDVNHVAWSPAGARVASVSDDNTVRVWFRDIETALPFWHEADRQRREAAAANAADQLDR